MAVVQAGLADGDDLGMPGQFAQRRTQIFRRFQGLARMPAGRRENTRELFAQLDRTRAAFQVGTDGYDFCDARRRGPFHHRRQILCELRIIQVRVCVVKNRHRPGRPPMAGGCHLRSAICKWQPGLGRFGSVLIRMYRRRCASIQSSHRSRCYTNQGNTPAFRLISARNPANCQRQNPTPENLCLSHVSIPASRAPNTVPRVWPLSSITRRNPAPPGRNRPTTCSRPGTDLRASKKSKTRSPKPK